MVELIASAFGWFALGWACRGWVLKRRLRNPPYSSAAIAWEEGRTQRGNGHGGPSTPKPLIKPQPLGGHPIREGQTWGSYQPRPQPGTPNPPPKAP